MDLLRPFTFIDHTGTASHFNYHAVSPNNTSRSAMYIQSAAVDYLGHISYYSKYTGPLL